MKFVKEIKTENGGKMLDKEIGIIDNYISNMFSEVETKEAKECVKKIRYLFIDECAKIN